MISVLPRAEKEVGFFLALTLPSSFNYGVKPAAAAISWGLPPFASS